MLKIALTGNIGSGKSTISRVFESMDIPVFYADAEAKKFYNEPDVLLKVKELFGEAVFDGENISIQKLASRVFAEREALKQLEALIHPLVMKRFEQWVIQQSDKQMVIMENAVLFEGGFDKYFDVIILVSAPEHIKLQRIMDRDGISADKVYQRMQYQWPEEKMKPFCQYVIVNDNQQSVIEQVINILNELKDFS